MSKYPYFDSKESKSKAVEFIRQIYDALIEAGANARRLQTNLYYITSRNPYFDLAWADEIQSRSGAYDGSKYTGKVRVTVSGPGARAKTFRERKNGTLNIAGIVEYAMEILEREAETAKEKREAKEIRSLAAEAIRNTCGRKDARFGWGGLRLTTPGANFKNIIPIAIDGEPFVSCVVELPAGSFKALVEFTGGVIDADADAK